jgi:hypothetical protein
LNYTPYQEEFDRDLKKFFYTPMPGKRADGQILIGAALDAGMIATMDKLRGGVTRSQYVRQAIAEKMQAEGYKVPQEWIYAPDRTGRGGRPKKSEMNIQIAANHGTVNITQKKRSTSTSNASGAKDVSRRGKKPEK